ncbi:hypothetical protein L917_21599 [Phytophthora nicotianae]|uniref:Uncharacterized protein n=1 Tax=Phytophthora nicotianae TaxID=4792 RepID=W2JYS7_PHYNI|nr:hypothetical protein L917_21599 [Phytophthora nicotianae]
MMCDSRTAYCHSVDSDYTLASAMMAKKNPHSTKRRVLLQ